MIKNFKDLCAFTATMILSSNFLTAQITNPAPYCVASYDEVEFYVPRYITEVKLGTMTNTTGTTHFEAPHYVYYNNVAAPELQKGQSYTLTVGNDGSVAIHYLSAYIDFNGNNVFDLPQEMVLAQNIHDNPVTNPSIAQFTVPADAVSGTTRMRVMIYADDVYTWGQTSPEYLACTAFGAGTLDWGETEDYNVTIGGGSSVSIESVDALNKLVISPNPADEFIHVTDAMKGASIEILSVDGRRLMFQEEVTGDRIDVSTLQAGTVIVKINKNGVVSTETVSIR